MGLFRVFTEIVLPFSISLLVVILYFLFAFDSESLAKRITTINSSISTVIAIQVGFNITSLALIASFGKQTALQTFKSSTEDERKTNMNQIISSFVYGITIYFIVLVLGVIHLTLLEPLSIADTFANMKVSYLNILKLFYLFSWCFFILHGFAVFLRNVILIQLYLLVNVKNE